MKTSFTSLLVSFAVILVLVSPQGLNASSCLQEWVGDGYCDPECNILEFSLDGGDCCEEDCLNGEDLDYECGTNGYDCKKPIENTNKYQLTREYSGFTLTLQCDMRHKRDMQSSTLIISPTTVTISVVNERMAKIQLCQLNANNHFLHRNCHPTNT